MRWTLLLIAALSFFDCEAVLAQAKPEVGAELKPFKAFGVTGQFNGAEVELAKPVEHRQVYLFVAADKFDRPTARYIRALDEAILKGIEGVSAIDAYAVWFTDNAQASKDYLPKAQQSLRLGQVSMAVFEGPKQGPDGLGIDPDTHLTVVLLRNGKITASFAYGSTNDTDVPELINVIKK